MLPLQIQMDTIAIIALFRQWKNRFLNASQHFV